MAGMRRHKAESGYSRGEETRVRIIRVAMALFGEKGFDGVSTREIATKAEVPAPSLQYYFENKEGLYAACLTHIYDAALAAMGPALTDAEALLVNDVLADRLIEAYCDILDSMADFMFGGPDATSRALFIARQRFLSDAVQTTAKLNKTPGKRIQDCCAGLVAKIIDKPIDEEARLVSVTINGQLFIVHIARDRVKDLIGWDDITPERLYLLKQTVRTQATALLRYHMLAERAPKNGLQNTAQTTSTKNRSV